MNKMQKTFKHIEQHPKGSAIIVLLLAAVFLGTYSIASHHANSTVASNSTASNGDTSAITLPDLIGPVPTDTLPAMLTSKPKPQPIKKPSVIPVPVTAQVKPIIPVTPSQPIKTAVAPLLLPYTMSNFSNITPWKVIQGSVSSFYSQPLYKNLLDVKAPSNSSTGFIELAGSEGWTDYSFLYHMNFISGTEFSLIARYQDSENYTACVFGKDGETRIDNVVDGDANTIVDLDQQISTIPYVDGIDYKMIVDGNDVQCVVNSQPIYGHVPDMPSKGGIGIQTYNHAHGTSEVKVQDITVTAL